MYCMSKQTSEGSGKLILLNKEALMGYIWIVIFTSLLMIFTPILLHLFSFAEMLSNTYAAILGVAMTAIISWALLNGQTSIQSKKALENEKRSKVYEEKIRFYQHFLKRLYEIIKDNKIEPEEALELKFAVASLALHTDSAKIKSISQQVKKIMESVGASGNIDETSKDQLMESLLKIVVKFNEELFEKEGGVEELDSNLREAIENFKSISDPVTENAEAAKTGGAQVLQMVESYINKCDDYKECFEVSSNINDGWIVLRASSGIAKEHDLRVQFALDPDGNYYFQVHWVFDDDAQRRRTYMGMRSLFGGGFNKWCWWYRLNAADQKLLSSAAISPEQATSLTAEITRLFNAAIPWMHQYSLSYSWYERLRKHFIDSPWNVCFWMNHSIGLHCKAEGCRYPDIALSVKTHDIEQGQFSLTMEEQGGSCKAEQMQSLSAAYQGTIEPTDVKTAWYVKKNVSYEEIEKTLDTLQSLFEAVK